MNIFFLLAIALAPGAAIGLYIYWKDKHEREPLGLLVKSFFFGVISTLITLLISWPISRLIPLDPTSLTQQAVHAFLLVALIEEFSKFIFVRWVLYPNKNFNEPFDGIVYSVTVSLGFAGLENILYVMDGGVETAVLRMFTAVPAHASFGVLMGYFLGKAKFEHKKAHYAIYALGVATLFHGAYDYFWFISYVPGIWIGAVISLIIGIVLSRRAIHIHQQASPFIRRDSEEDRG
ncbi:MAG: PrsW family intramembrane metalloprotease [Cytophagales bacterium]|jgi:RsiW-degrading membrane proteinase PrsW (M82 family)|nr:PrsW family intramembrane metalloprotease [Cytophagales bacterium]MCA6368085.1 PrsW family intramembrane metalloprotease [Cytophagales bacterium]MCA6370599.1 PrsW family intramembrane metalloprotease [Cytophagales bacterium]MCA6375692.1 PrsW family intramembrane metalloprotease [Cytophagales bacterium]MCA6384085.1 PrsW family intramembrane metalloprotease [Cytophagales bacterium]